MKPKDTININMENTQATAQKNKAYNVFYGNISIFFRILSFALFVSFLIFIIASAFAGVEHFTYDNLEYIVRNFALKLDENKDASLSSINYNPDSNRSFAPFGKGLAVCGSSQLMIYSATGRLTCSEMLEYKDPVMSASDKFVLVYDNGNIGYTLYNSFTDVHSAYADYPIRGASVSDNGSHAIITSSDSYNSVVKVYNSKYQLVGAINRTGYISAVDINNTHVLVACADIDEENRFASKLIYSAIGENSIELEITIEESFPLFCAINEDGFTAVCDDAVYFYDINGKLKSSYIYNSALYDFVSDDSGVLLLFKNSGFNTEYSAVSVDRSGSTPYEEKFTGTVNAIEFSNGFSYVLTADGVIHCSSREDSFEKHIAGTGVGTCLISYGDRSLYVCKNTSAPLVSID